MRPPVLRLSLDELLDFLEERVHQDRIQSQDLTHNGYWDTHRLDHATELLKSKTADRTLVRVDYLRELIALARAHLAGKDSHR